MTTNYPMFDLIEEELSNEKNNTGPEPQFKEEEHPVVTMPTIYKRERRVGGGGNNKGLLFIIFGSLFGMAIIGTVVFLVVTRPQPTPPPQAPGAQAPDGGEQPRAEPTIPEVPDQQAEQQPVIEEEEKGVQPTPVVPSEPALPLLGIDSDQDGLTDLEERLYATNPQLADSDGDSFIDGDEVKNLYDPLRAEQSRLDISGLVNTYTNQTYQYSVLYPSSWIAQSTDRTDRELMISAATGEFFTITVLSNPNRLSPLDWYASQTDPGADTSRLQSFTYDTWSGVMTPDSLTVYLTRNQGDEAKQTVLYGMKYNLNTKNELNFITTMQMMLRSFVFTDLSFVK